MSDVSADLSAFFEAQEVDVATYEHLSDAVYTSFKSHERFSERLAEYRQLVEQGQGEALKLALGLLVLGRFSDALDWFGKTPDGKFRRYYAAEAASALSRHETALAELHAAASKGWDTFEIDMRSAAVHIQLGDLAAADTLVQRHSSAGQDRADWYYVQGLLYENRDDWAPALEQYEKALALDPDHAQAMFRAAWLYDIHGDDEAAIELYQRLALLPRAHVNALINLAVIYEDLGEYEDALDCVQRVLKAYPNHTRARLFLKDIESCLQMVVEEAGDEQVDLQTRVLDTPISDFELSVRARNCLKKMNVNTLGDLLKLTEAELLSYKNFGETSLSEIRTLLSKRGLHLGQPPGNIPPEILAPSPQPRVAVPPGRESVLSKPVSELELSVRARRCLQRLAVASLGDLIQMSEAELLATRNFGVTSLNEVKARLSDFNLQLAPKNAE
ncbi:MAG: DNA-directed RNA polymerase subunit alpha C-terminal domain-containing protein [Planctomycetota bacterium]